MCRSDVDLEPREALGQPGWLAQPLKVAPITVSATMRHSTCERSPRTALVAGAAMLVLRPGRGGGPMLCMCFKLALWGNPKEPIRRVKAAHEIVCRCARHCRICRLSDSVWSDREDDVFPDRTRSPTATDHFNRCTSTRGWQGHGRSY